MIKFKIYISEGGNLSFDDEHGNKRVSDSIEVEHRDKQSKDFKDMFHSIDKSFHEKHGHNLFGNSLKNNTFASGSSQIYNDPNISTERMKKSKPHMGDYDVQIPEQHRSKLNDLLKPGQTHGKFLIHHVRTSGSQTHAIVKHKETGKYHQIDFEPVEYDEKTHEPTDYEKFSHSSDMGDTEKGLKGVHHKLLLQSVFSAHSKPVHIAKSSGRGKEKKEVLEPGQAAPHTFSVDKGLRQKWEKVGEKDGTDIVKEKPTKDSVYTKDLHQIYKAAFHKTPEHQDIKDIHSFGGLVDHIKKHIPSEHHGKIVKTFTEKLWHPSAQATSISPKEDKKLKEKAHAELERHFPSEVSSQKEETEKMKHNYYNDPKKFARGENLVKESSDDESHYHVAIAAGRFTGPTLEHQKLLDKVFSQKADKHHVFVMGPSTKEQTTEKDPLTIQEKIEHLKKLYPEHKDSFVAGDHPHTKNPQKALVWAWHQHKDKAKNIHLNVVAGSGEEGIAKKSQAGGSLDSYKGIVDRYNHTKFPSSQNPDGTTKGGDTRMSYSSVKYTSNPRGNVSGSVMRKVARESDHNNRDHVEKFKSLLHSGFSHEDAKNLMKKIKERSSIKESTFKKVKRILGE